MRHWKISFLEYVGNVLFKYHVIIDADSFDEALRKAREKDPRFNTGQILTDEELTELIES